MSENKNKRPVDLIGPVLLIGIGVIVLLNNLNMLDWSFWDVLRLWPILLVAAGLEIVIGRHSLAGSLISAVVVLGLILGAIWLGDMSGMSQALGTYESVSIPLDDAVSANLTVNTGVAEVRIAGMSDSSNLVEGEVNPGRRTSLVTDYDGGASVDVTLTAKGPAAGWSGPNNGGHWNVKLSDDVVYNEMIFDQGVGEITLDLRDLMLDSVVVEYGIGQIKVQLPGEGKYELDLDGGIGEVVVEVPEGLGVKVDVDKGLVPATMPSDWENDGDIWTNDAYGSADHTANIIINLGIGSITVREVGE